MMKTAFLAAAALVSSTAAFAVGTVEPVGKWKTSNGPLTIEKAPDGHYLLIFEEFPGSVTGVIYADGTDGGDMRMKGVWHDIITAKECPQASEGSKHWGGFDVTFHGPPNLDREVFGGIITFCELIKPMPTDGTPQVTEGWNFSGEKAK